MIVCCWSLLEVAGPLVEVVHLFLPLQYVAALLEQSYPPFHSGAAVFEHFYWKFPCSSYQFQLDSLSLVPANKYIMYIEVYGSIMKSLVVLLSCLPVQFGSVPLL